MSEPTNLASLIHANNTGDDYNHGHRASSDPGIYSQAYRAMPKFGIASFYPLYPFHSQLARYNLVHKLDHDRQCKCNIL